MSIVHLYTLLKSFQLRLARFESCVGLGSGLGRARVRLGSGLSFTFCALDFLVFSIVKIGLKAFKIWALKTGLKKRLERFELTKENATSRKNNHFESILEKLLLNIRSPVNLRLEDDFQLKRSRFCEY
jgi:hypothetical protein